MMRNYSFLSSPPSFPPSSPFHHHHHSILHHLHNTTTTTTTPTNTNHHHNNHHDGGSSQLNDSHSHLHLHHHNRHHHNHHNSYDHHHNLMMTNLWFSTILACFLIGLSSMLSLFVFNLLIHRRNPFRSSSSSSSTTTRSHSNGVVVNGNLVKNGNISAPKLQPQNSSSSTTVTTTTPTSLINDPSKSEILKLVLSFAVGGLLGDVFLHLLPEASVQLSKMGFDVSTAQHYLGTWILTGVIVFVCFESCFVQLQQKCTTTTTTTTTNAATGHDHHHHKQDKDDKTMLKSTSNGTTVLAGNGSSDGLKLRKKPSSNHISENGSTTTVTKQTIQTSPSSSPSPSPSTPINVTGYLNLLANGFDNFTHGMSVGASFLISIKMGCLTTLAIAIHEIPHEIVDYVILLRSGFNCWSAFRAQLSISLVTIFGALTVLYCESESQTLHYTLWILPFTAGGFVYIALTSLLPEVLNFDDDIEDGGDGSDQDEHNNHQKVTTPTSSLNKIVRLVKRITLLLAGIGTMAAVNVIDIF